MMHGAELDLPYRVFTNLRGLPMDIAQASEELKENYNWLLF